MGRYHLPVELDGSITERAHNASVRRHRRPLTCILGLHGMHTAGDNRWLWGECPVCGYRAGTVSRAVLRYLMERESKSCAPRPFKDGEEG